MDTRSRVRYRQDREMEDVITTVNITKHESLKKYDLVYISDTDVEPGYGCDVMYFVKDYIYNGCRFYRVIARPYPRYTAWSTKYIGRVLNRSDNSSQPQPGDLVYVSNSNENPGYGCNVRYLISINHRLPCPYQTDYIHDRASAKNYTYGYRYVSRV